MIPLIPAHAGGGRTGSAVPPAEGEDNMKTSASLAYQTDSGFAPFAAADFQRGLDWAASLGFDGVEPIIQYPDRVDADQLNAQLDQRGLVASTIATGQMAGEGLVFCSPAEEIRRGAVERICRHIDLADRLVGRPHVTIGLARGKGDPARAAQQLAWTDACVAACADYAAKKNIVLNLEPINRYECALMNSTAEGAEMMERIGNPSHIGILYDTFHSNIEDPDPIGAIRRYGGQIAHVHFADSNRRVPGGGHIPFDAIVRALREAGYDGFVSLEVLNLPDAEAVRAQAGAVNRLVKNL